MEVGAGVEDNGASVRTRKAHVEFFQVGVAGQAPSGGGARIQVSHALVIGDEVDSRSDPHGRSEVPLELDQEVISSAAFPIDPKGSSRASPIALPAGGIG